MSEADGLWWLLAGPAAGLALQAVQWTTPLGQPMSVRLLQGNVPQDLKFDVDQLETTLALYQRMITEAPADLIATPETALPILASQLPEFLTVDLGSLAKGQTLHVKDIKLADGIKVMTQGKPNPVIVSVSAQAAEEEIVAPVVTAAAAAPTKAKKTEKQNKK